MKSVNEINEINEKNKCKINDKMKTRRTDEFIKIIPDFVVASVLLLPKFISHEVSFLSDALPLIFLFLTKISYCYLVGFNVKLYEVNRISKKNKQKGRKVSIKDFGDTFIDESVGMIGVQSVFAIIILLIVAFVCSIKHVSLAISDTIAVLSIFYTTIFVDWIRQDGIGKGISDLRNVLKHKEKKFAFSYVRESLQNVIYVGMIIICTIYYIKEAITNYFSLIKLFI